MWHNSRSFIIQEARPFDSGILRAYFHWFNSVGMPTIFPETHMPAIDAPLPRQEDEVAQRAYVPHGPNIRRVV